MTKGNMSRVLTFGRVDARVEQDEHVALEKLEQAALVVARMHDHARVRRRILKTRRAGVAIVHEAEDRAADLIIIANRPVSVRGASQPIDAAVEYVMRNAPCEVLVFSQARATAGGNLRVVNM